MRERDPMLRRLERTAGLWCLALAALAVAARGGRADVGAGVLGGGLLAGVSYWTTKAWVDRLGRGGRDEPGRRVGRRRVGAAVLVLTVRYALLAVLAYVMMARLRLHPIGLLLGASAVGAAAATEAIRAYRS